MNVYVLHFVHKHGEDISVWKTELGAQAVATELMLDRANSWDQADRATFDRLVDFDLRLKFFNETEGGISYGERIEILKRPVQ